MATGVQRITGNPNIRKYLCASATPAFVAGDLVTINASGLLVIATAGDILGIAKANHPASTSVYVPVDIIDPVSDFLVHAAGATATTDVGDILDILPTTTAVTTTADSVHDVCVNALWPGDAVGTSGGRYIVKFSPGSITASAKAA